MADQKTLQWLLENGGPAIRYRTATELSDSLSDADIEQLKANLFASDMTQTWLDRIGNPSDIWSFHGSPTAFENPCYKLCDLGLKAGMPAFDEKTARFRRLSRCGKPELFHTFYRCCLSGLRRLWH